MEFIIGLIVLIIFLNTIFGNSSSPSTSSETIQPTETADMFQMNMAAEEDATPEA